MKLEESRPARNTGRQQDRDTRHLAQKLCSVYKLAETYCANWCRGGSCEGAGFDSTGRHIRWRKAGQPCLLGLGQRCPYFETAVLPMERRSVWPTTTQGEAFRKTAGLYHSAFPETEAAEPEIRKCPDCGKRSVEPRKRYCTQCRNRRRKVTDAESHRKWRKSEALRHTVKQNGSSLGAASRGAISDVRYPLSDPPVFDL
jgi:hypothetical protein